jgi:pyruvate formate lyase activating enzyme
MLRCDFDCAYCQNWFTSQSQRDDVSTRNSTSVSANDIGERENNATGMVSTYNEFFINSEWVVEVFNEAKQKKLWASYLSNGY